jgi:hypothetical protein
MRKINFALLLSGLSLFFAEVSFCQDSAKTSLILNLGYYNDNNQMQYLKAVTKTKVNGKFKLVAGIPVSFYITSESPTNLLGKSITDDKGQVSLLIPPSARQEWNKSPKQSFLAISDSTKLFDATKTSIDLTKSKIKIDTAEDKKIVATLYELKDSLWVPVKGVDMKLAVKRLGGDLNVNETPTYTTDSLGMVNADFKLLNIPGDTLGNLVLIAKVEDNDIYGNLTTEKTVPWGKETRYQAAFNQRSLFARRGWSPLWLEWMAYSIIACVWFVLLYLVMQIRKLKRLGV